MQACISDLTQGAGQENQQKEYRQGHLLMQLSRVLQKRYQLATSCTSHPDVIHPVSQPAPVRLLLLCMASLHTHAAFVLKNGFKVGLSHAKSSLFYLVLFHLSQESADCHVSWLLMDLHGQSCWPVLLLGGFSARNTGLTHWQACASPSLLPNCLAEKHAQKFAQKPHLLNALKPF